MEKFPSKYSYFSDIRSQPYVTGRPDFRTKNRAGIEAKLEEHFVPPRTFFSPYYMQLPVDTTYCNRQNLKRNIEELDRTSTTFEKMDGIAALDTLMMKYGLQSDNELLAIKAWLEQRTFPISTGAPLLQFSQSSPSPAKQTIHDKHRIMTAMGNKEKQTGFRQGHAGIRKHHEKACSSGHQTHDMPPVTSESRMELAKRNKQLLRLHEIDAREVRRLVTKEMRHKDLRLKLKLDREINEFGACDMYSSDSEMDCLSPGRVNDRDNCFNND